jgi:uncharacterized membrane protein YfcA
MVDSFEPETLAIAAAIAAVAGIVRGITGFGGAMVMSPPMALLLGPLAAVPVVLLLESVAATPMWVAARRLVQWKVIGPILAAACITVPVGTWILISVDPLVMRRVIATVVILFSLVLLRGWRYHGEQRAATGLGLGAVSGTMVGATSMGGPPVILYLLAGPHPIEVTRANLTFFVGGISFAGIAMLAIEGVLGRQELLLALILAPGYYGGIMLGTRMFARFNDQRFRQFTLALMLLVSTGILLA